MRGVIAIIGLSLIITSVAIGQGDDHSEKKDVKKQYLYEWKDNAGNVHITDAFGNVPEEYRDKVQKIESQKGQEPGPEANGSAGASLENSESNDAAAKAEWQQRVREWKSRLANAEKRYQELDRERNELFRAWGSPAVAPVETRMRADQIDEEMKDVRAQIENAKQMLNSVLPEEARKQGVPPGWLRE